MADPGQVVKTISEDPGLLQRGLLWAFGALGALSALTYKLAVASHRKEIDGINEAVDGLGGRFQKLEHRVDEVERTYTSNDRFDKLADRLENKIDQNHRDIMQVLLERRQAKRSSD